MAVIKNLTRTDERVEKGCFSAQNFGKVELVGHSFGTVLYRDFEGESAAGVYGEGIMAVSSKKFQTWAIELFQEENCSDGRVHSVWRLPA